MIQFLNKLFVGALITFILIYFLLTIWKEPFLIELLSATGLMMLLSIFIVLPKRDLLLPVLLIILSMMIVWITSSSPIVLWIGLREMSAIIPLIILISLVSWIIGHRPYVKALMTLGKKRITTPIRFFSFVAVITHFISSFMTVGGIAFVYQMFRHEKKSSVSDLAWDFTLSTAIMRGFTLTVLWTAVHPAFAYGIAGTNAPLLPTMLKGLGLAFIGFVISIIIYWLQMKQKQVSADLIPELSVSSEEKMDGLIREFLFWVLLLMAGIFILNQWFHLDILLSVPVVIVSVTTLYFVSNQAVSQYKKLWFQLVTVDLGKKKKEIFLILSAGLLVGTLKETGQGHELFEYFLFAVDWLNINILIGLTFAVIMLGFSGIPPIPAMVLISGILVTIPG
ncbi:hypothetical protein RJD24_20770 [Bacillaceae bacterium IKA-2]|nr:hypothetical protein RJD24_20770 [Bacillaceae bacterium IKA-2]